MLNPKHKVTTSSLPLLQIALRSDGNHRLRLMKRLSMTPKTKSN